MNIDFTDDGLRYTSYNRESADQLRDVSRIIDVNLLEPYSIYVYWYFFHSWPQYCVLVWDKNQLVGVIIAKVGPHRDVRMRGYIGMLVIEPPYRKRGIASKLVNLIIDKMKEWDKVDEVMLETEVDNGAALHLYELLGFLRTKRLHRYYLNTQDAYRLVLPLLERLTRRVAFLPAITQGIVT